MLSLLHIENIALIESADICFGPGFNALTGETGAGKSIVIDSISAVLGERTSRDLIRTGADVIGRSQTGTGKTFAFAIPAIERIDREQAQPTPQVLLPQPYSGPRSK